jgi:hypothetical protein
MKVLVACEFSGVVREAFRRRGHKAYSCDLLPASDGSPFHFEQDVLKTIEQEKWDLMIAHPPCTALCVTGNRHYAGTEEREEAINFVGLLAQSPIDKIAIENPVGVISSFFRPPDQYIQPYEFGHPVSKKTGLWLKNLPKLVPTNIVPCDEPVVFSSGRRMSKWYYETSLLPQSERATARSITFKGIAEAMAEQWG